jgi:hypothetical protein
MTKHRRPRFLAGTVRKDEPRNVHRDIADDYTVADVGRYSVILITLRR